MLTQGAVGNLINRYMAVLKKCRLMNTFGSLALAAVLVAGASGAAMGFDIKFDEHVPEYPDFIVNDGTDVGPPETTSYLEEWQTGVSYGAATGADTPALVYADKNSPIAENHGYIWVKSSEKGGYAEAMGGQYGTGFSLTNHGHIYVDGTTSSATKGMGVNPNGIAYNEGIIAVRKGSAMADNSGSSQKTIVNNGLISVEDAGGVGIYYRKENITRGEVTNNGTIQVGNGGTGVLITNDKNDETYNNKYFTNTGTITADNNSTAILVTDTDNATVNLKGDKSRVEGLISLQGTNNNLTIDGMGMNGVESLYVKGTFSGKIGNHSNIEFTKNSKFSIDDALSIDQTSSVVLSNVSLARGENDADKALLIFDDNGTVLNGGMKTGGTASMDSLTSKKDGITLDGAVVSGNKFITDKNQPHVGVVAATLSEGQGVSISNSLFADNSTALTNASSQYGGAAVAVSGIDGNTVAISKTDFINNAADAEEVRGAALSVKSSSGSTDATSALNSSLTLKDVSFESNSAKGQLAYGGGMYLESAGKNAIEAKLAGVTFKNNVANGSSGGFGGALYNNGSSLTIADSTFEDNRATASGGALYNAANGHITFNGNNIFTGNAANGTANDVHNAGTLTVADGVTRFDSGYTQQGAHASLNVNTGATLAIALPDTGGVTAAPGEAMLALGRPLDLAGGRLRVGDVLTRDSSDVAFGKNSLLVVDGLAAKSGPMLTGSGSLAVEEGSKLYIANAQAGEAYTVTEGLTAADGDYWKTANLLTGRLIEAEITTESGKIMVHTEAQDASRTLPGVIPVNGLNAMVSKNKNDTEALSTGIRFLSRAMDNVQYMPSDTMAVAMVNEVSRAAVTAGVQNTALRLSDAGVDQISRHLSLSFFDKENSIHRDGLDIWAAPMYGNTYTHGMAVSGTAVRGNYGGMALGADTQIGEIMGGKVRFGASLNGGGGKSETRGTATDTKNSYNFGGLNLYAGWNLDNLNIIASAGYSIGTHDVSMSLPSSMGMGQAKADVDTTAFIADLRAEYQINTDVVDILPHAGVRYTSLNTDSHKVRINGSTLNSVSSDTQDIVQFPVGVTLTKSIDVSGWNIKPQADVSVIPAAGDKKILRKSLMQVRTLSTA